MNLPIGGGIYATTQHEQDALLAADDPSQDLDELPGVLQQWYWQYDAWWGVASYHYPVHGEQIGLAPFLGVFPADRLRPRERQSKGGS